MKMIIHFLLLCVLPLSAFTQSTTPQAKPADSPAQKPPQFDLEPYQLGLLRKGPNSGTGTKEEAEKIQAGHMANIGKMAESGKLLAAGPMMDNGDLRGIFLFKAASLDEAKALAAEDPAIKAGRLKLDLYMWQAPKNIGVQLNEAYRKNPKIAMTMTKYHFALLRRGKAMDNVAELQKLVTEHLWGIRRMMDAGQMPAAGPINNGGELAGIFVFATDSTEQAKAWADADPLVKAGYMTTEIHPWFVAKEVWPESTAKKVGLVR